MEFLHIPSRKTASSTNLIQVAIPEVTAQRCSSCSSILHHTALPCHLRFVRNGAHPGNPQPIGWIRTFNSYDQWSFVQEKLKELKRQLDNQDAVTSNSDLVRRTVVTYCEAATASNFRLLDDAEITPRIRAVLPFIVDLALELSLLHFGPIPALTSGDNSKILVSRRMCAAVLANGFFCTFSNGDRINSRGEDYPSINFFDLFDIQFFNPANYRMKLEKLKCILNYFECNVNVLEDSLEPIAFIRKSQAQQVNWMSQMTPLCGIHPTETGSIESSGNYLKCDFANRLIGGGVLRNGCVMEEIQFSICPELIVSRLFTAPLDDHDSMEIVGAKSFSFVRGYSNSFRYMGSIPIHERQRHHIVAIDAIQFTRADAGRQFLREQIDRELHKAYVGFSSDSLSSLDGIATGNWGCGFFNGNPHLKFLIQWIAASEASWGNVRYFTFGNLQQSEEMKVIANNLKERGITTGKLYEILTATEQCNGTVFEKVQLACMNGNGQ